MVLERVGHQVEPTGQLECGRGGLLLRARERAGVSVRARAAGARAKVRAKVRARVRRYEREDGYLLGAKEQPRGEPRVAGPHSDRRMRVDLLGASARVVDKAGAQREKACVQRGVRMPLPQLKAREVAHLMCAWGGAWR